MSTGETGQDAPKSFYRRDHLRDVEIKMQKRWQEEKPWEAEIDESKEKYLITFPYPYMNGRLHLGHAFSFTKAEFTGRFQRLLGKNVLFPFGFHCTGMPIQAASNKLKEELATYGNPPIFPEPIAKETSPEPETKSAEEIQASKSKGKKTKLAVKGQSGPMRQYDILSKMVPQESVPEFSDPMKWLNYFPPLGVQDLQAFGSCIDWRRSFITTSVNPSYDAFIRWQFNKLREGNRIQSGYRPNVYSVKDGQCCADHDRASGEAVVPQEYTLVKLLVPVPYPQKSILASCNALEGKKVYLVPATLRAETMYGQTNCFVLPEGDYGAFEFKNDEVFIMSERAALGLAHQESAIEWGKLKCLIMMKGQDLLGLPLKAPNAIYDIIYTLPLTTISMGKGTGVVTSVPSDAPDDYAALRELKEKPLWREKFGITAEMVEPFDVVPIIEIPGYGNQSAVFMCEKLDIKSSKDAQKLKEAKDEVYLKGFYEGVMLVGECKGMKVVDAKPLVRKSLIESGHALPYWEPESTVIGRSGDECIVALTDQWYLFYGDKGWQSAISTHLHSKDFNGYNASVVGAFDKAIDWLKEWACSRKFGLGTKLPWDEKWVIDSLSDSTIYMAYYTIAHLLHGDPENLKGVSNPVGIQPGDLTDEIFSYIFLRQPLPTGYVSKVPQDLLDRMQREFEYWYPMDLRVSAKDLIPNHLTMCLYNHVAIWKEQPEMWPRGIYCNGHIMVDAEKMSKSKGNFLMLLECVNDYSADATRFALADAGDSLEDANFDRKVANQAILYLYNEEEWIKSVMKDISEGKLRTGDCELQWMDKAFDNEIIYCSAATRVEFEKMCYRDGIHHSWYGLIIARDLYRDWSYRTGIPLHKDVVLNFIKSLVIINSPIIPHWSEFIWEMIGGHAECKNVCNAGWPQYGIYDPHLRKEFTFFKDFMKNIRIAILKEKKLAEPKCTNVYMASSYEENKVTILKYLISICDVDAGFPSDAIQRMKAYVDSDESLKKVAKLMLQFGAFMIKEAQERGLDALTPELTFNQRQILEENKAYMARALDLKEMAFYDNDATDIPKADVKKATMATPGKPSYGFYTGSS